MNAPAAPPTHAAPGDAPGPEPLPYPDSGLPEDIPVPPPGGEPVTWPGMTDGVSVTVAGGAYTVDTTALRDLATTLTTASTDLDEARVEVLTAKSEAETAVAPPEDGSYVGPVFGNPDAVAADGPSIGGCSGFVVTDDGFDFVDPSVCLTMPSPAQMLEGMRTRAINATAALADGPGSLHEASQKLQLLATQLTTCADAYENAEANATTSVVEDPAVYGPMLQDLGFGSAVSTSLGWAALTRGATDPDVRDFFRGSGRDAVDGFSMIASDPDLESWVVSDLTTMLLLLTYVGFHKGGDKSSSVEKYLETTAERLDPEISPKLPDLLTDSHGNLVPKESLTAMERIVYYLVMRADDVAYDRYGPDYGVTVTARGGIPVTLPPSRQDPMGLKTLVERTRTTGEPVTEPLGSASDVIRYCDSLDAADDGGVVSVVRTEHADGTTSWLVVVPGTTDWGVGGPNPHDLQTNLEAVAGAPNDMETAVVTAMRQAGIQPGDPVALYGHSQGGIVASNIAADPDLGEQYNITTVLTAGSPTAGADIPDDVDALHVENVGDPVPALDAAATPRSPNRTVVTVDTSDSDLDGFPHPASFYADAVEGMSGPGIDEWNHQLEQITGAGEDGATSTEFVFDVTRHSASTDHPRNGMAPPMPGYDRGPQFTHPDS